MALGQSGRSLIIWDPTVIPAAEGPNGRKYPEQSIANFNKAPDPAGTGDHCVGRLPEGVPDSFPKATDKPFTERVSWNAPKRREP